MLTAHEVYWYVDGLRRSQGSAIIRSNKSHDIFNHFV